MAPIYNAGDIIIIDPSNKPNPGQDVLAIIESDKTVIFRKYRDNGKDGKGYNYFELIPNNDNWATVTVDSGSRGKIIGMMVYHLRGG